MDRGWGEGATARGALGRLVRIAWAKQLGCPGWVARGQALQTSPPGGGAPSAGTAQKPVSALQRSDLLGTSPEGAHESTHAG